jgi:hypothetical protein
MRTITYMKGGRILTREVPDLTAQEQAALDARKALIANRRLQQEARSERATLRTVALDQIIKDGAVSKDLRDYAAALDAIVATPADELLVGALPEKPQSLKEI